MLLNCSAGEDSWESLGLRGDQTSQSWRKSTLNIHWKGWYWSWSPNNLATWCEEPAHWKRPWCWERLKADGEGDDRGWDCWMASPTQWIWIWANSGRWWRTEQPGLLQSVVSWRVRHDLATESTTVYDCCYIQQQQQYIISWLFYRPHFRNSRYITAESLEQPWEIAI